MPIELLLHRIAISVVPVFFIALCGYLYGLFQRPSMDTVNKINMDIFLPILIFWILSSKVPSLVDTLPLIIGSTIVIVGSGILCFPLSRLLRINPRTFLPPVMFTNTGNLGLPIILLLFGERGLASGIIVFITENLLHFTLGLYLINRKSKFINELSFPMIFSTVAGVAFAASGYLLPKIIMSSFEIMGKVSIPLLLFSLGVRMTDIRANDLKVATLSAVSGPLAGLIIALVILPLLALDQMETDIFLIFSVLPPAVLNYLVAERYNQEPRRVASMVLIGNLGALFWIPIALYLAVFL